MKNPNTNPTPQAWWTRIASLLALTLFLGSASAQNITTTFANNNGSSVVVFSIQNNSTTAAYLLNEIGSVANFTGTGTARLYAKPATYGVAPGATGGGITAGNGWTDIGSNLSVVTVANTTGSGNTATSWISGLNYIIPPQSQVRFCLQHVSTPGAASFSTSVGAIRYSNVGVQPCQYINGDIELNACANYAYGGTMAAPTFTPRGFIGFINFSAAGPCSGTPAPGNTLSSVTSTCSGANFNFNLSLQNATSGTGVTYQWQRADDAGFTVNVTNFGTDAAAQTTSQTADSWYRCIVTCTSSGQSGTSTPVQVTMITDACACPYNLVGIAGDPADEDITVCTIGTMSNPTACNSLAPGPGSIAGRYSNFTGSVTGPSADQGATVPFSVGQGTLCGGTWGNGVKIYVDWNQDGDWLDLDEEVFSQAAAASGVNVQTGSFTVPVTATPGVTRMRVVVAETTFPDPTNYAHTGYTWGETEDYCFTVTLPLACDAPPAVNTALSTLSSACAGTNFTLSLQDAVSGTGITYEWQSADDAGFTSNLQSLGTGITQVASLTTASQYYRCVITCNNPNGGPTPSNAVLVNLVSDLCACGTYNLVGIPDFPEDEDITVCTIGTMSNPTACGALAPGSGSIAGRYSNFTGSVAGPAAGQGTSVPFSVGQGTLCGGTWGNGVKIYVDWNQDGDWLDLDEEVFTQAAAASGVNVQTGSFTVPLTATLGVTRMRVVVVESAFPDPTNYAHTGYLWGETEDYCFTVLPPPEPAEATVSVVDDCIAGTFTIDVNVASFGSGSGADIEYSVNGGPPVIVPASLGTNIIPTSGSFLQAGDAVTITVTNGTISELDLGTFFGNCPIQVVCGNTVPISHCYGNNDPRVFIFVADDPLQTLTMTFIAGTMDPNDIIRTYAGTDENLSPGLISGSYADLGAPQLTIESFTDTIMLVIDSDGSNSCQDAQQTTWQFEVICQPPCVNPDGTAIVDVCTNEITVSLDFDGSGLTAGIRYAVNGGTPIDITGLNAPYVEVLGPFSPGDAVQVWLVNEDDEECIRNLGITNIVAIPAPPLVIASADPTEICPYGSTQLQATAVSATPPAVPAYAFEQFVGSYTPVTGGTLLGTATSDDEYFVTPLTPLGGFTTTGIGFPLGFNFTYNGEVYDRIAVNNNGWISFGNSALTPSVNMATTSAYTPLASGAATAPAHLRNRVAAFAADLQAQAGASLRIETLGSSPNQVCVIQWSNYKRWNVIGHTLNFQIRLYEGSNFVEVHYGPMVWTAVAYTAHVGLGGNAAAQFNNRATTTDWNNTIAGATNTASCTWATTAAYPTVGRVFRWRSPEIAGASYSWSPALNLDNAFISNPEASNVPSTETFTVTVTGDAFPCPGSTDVLVTVSDPLTVASITPGTASYCTGSTVLLTANAGDGVAPFTYQWYDPSNNPMGTAQTQAADVAGDWTCLVTDDCGASFLATASVSSIETPVVNVTPDQPTCAGYDIVLTANTVSGTPTSWLWSGPAPIGGQTTQSVTLNDITSANDGVYSVVATFNGCPSTPAGYTLTANPAPTITSSGAQPITVCPGDNSVLSVTATMPSGTYCTPTYGATGCTFPDYVANVDFAGINRSSLCDIAAGYINLSTPQGNVVAGSTYPISVTTDGDDENLSVWIDYNRNGVFENTERVLERLVVQPAPPAQTTTGNVTIPLTAFNGPTRMRVRCVYGLTYAQVDPCALGSFGETEDYVINITGGVDQIVYSWTGGTFLGGIDNTPSVTAIDINATTTYNIEVSSLGCTDTEDITVYYGTNEVTLDVQTDANGDDISYEFREEGTNTLMYYVGPNTLPNNADYSSLNCLPDGCFYLVVMDAGGDGILGGGYVLREGNGALRRIIDNSLDQYGNGGFTSGSVSQIAGNEGFCLPLGDDRLIYTSCDKLDWRVSPCGGEYMVANDNAAVSAQYGVNNANSGYQAWWYAPNGGYSFKRFQSHNTSNGLPASATRAAHFLLNGWAGNQLQQNVLYNVKVRGRINGVYNNWGSACRLIVNDALAACPRTKLMDLPGNQYLSCGQSRGIGTTQLVHARNVRRRNANCNWVNANRYQFRFRLPAENVVIIKTSATGQYWVNTNGLACNKTYEVDVRASFDNGSTWCVVTPDPNSVTDPLWGDMCLLTTNCSFGMAQEDGAAGEAGQSERTVGMYPNPNRGDQLILSVSSVEEGVETVTVDIFDAYGKRAMARTIAVQDGFVNTVLDLNGGLANGLYMVSITAGTDSYNERLVIQK